ncbi:MAG TPA: hypothetical protein VEJ87_07315 [Acidimicrobiales bacterium]|nr:hypothetical protein [Acidimicrobiales bacterium]
MVHLRRGWHEDAEEAGLYRYWNGSTWTGEARIFTSDNLPSWSRDTDARPMAGVSHYRLSRWRRFWYRGVVRLPFIYGTLGWCGSLPLLRGRLQCVTQPREQVELRELQQRYRPPS